MQKALMTLLIFLTFMFVARGQYKPKYFASVGGKVSGTVDHRTFIAQQGVNAERYIAGNHWEPITVDSFHVIILRDNSTLFTAQNKGNRFSPYVMKGIADTKPGDRILIFNVWATDLGNKKISLQPLEFLFQECGTDDISYHLLRSVLFLVF